MLKDGDLQRGDMFVEDYRDHPEDDGATFLHVILQNNTEVGYIRHALTTEIALEEMERNELEIHIINDADREGYDELKRRDRQIRKLKGHPRYIPKPQRRVGFKLRATTEEREFTHDEVRPDIKRRDL